MILLYSVRGTRSEFIPPPASFFFFFFIRRRAPRAGGEQRCTPEDTSVCRPSLPHCSKGFMEQTPPYQSRLLHATEKGQNLSLGTRHTKINPFSSETGIAFLSEDFFLCSVFCLFLKADVWQPTAPRFPAWKDPSFIPDLLVSWSWRWSPRRWSCPLSNESEHENSWHAFP